MMLHFRQVTLLLLATALISSLVVLISSVKYAIWASPSGLLGTSRWLPLLFYLGTMPIVSLLQNSIHLAILQLDVWIPHFGLLVLSCFQAAGWLVVSALWTTCEVSGRDAPAFCPQNFKSSVVIRGQHLMGVTILKDVLAWSLVGIYLGLALTARKGIYHDRRVQWRAKDQFHELAEYEPRMSFSVWAPNADGTFPIESRPVQPRNAALEKTGAISTVGVAYETKI